ncbi:hypothetical protein SDC9_154025 [bioreactor metagenome]|uniref:Uncharacterized protein n=1 Tax=bioreactor metagenome TaxID=1076179 RepID=A0A645EXJ3_9ZZZZ
MTLGADDKEAARLLDLFSLYGDLGAVFFIRLCEHASRFEHVLVVGIGVARGFVDNILVVAGLAKVAFGKIFRVASEHYIGSASGHVGRDGHGAELAGLGDYLGFLLMVLSIQHIMLDALFFEHLGQQFVLFNRYGTDEHGLSLFVARLRQIDDGAVFSGLRLVDDVGMVDTNDGLVGRYLNNVETIYGFKFLTLRQRGAGHARELFVKTEIVLEGY